MQDLQDGDVAAGEGEEQRDQQTSPPVLGQGRRQLEGNAYIIKKLEEDLKDRDRKCHDLLVEREQLKRTKEEPVAVVEKVKDKTYIEEMLYKSREMNDQNSKALTDSVNLIIVRMAEIEKKKEES